MSSEFVEEAEPTADYAAPPTIRLVTAMSELTATEEVQREVWGIDDREIVPASQLRAAVHAGGHVIGAFDDDALVGFAYGFAATPHGTGMAGVGLHSHMVAVKRTHRQQGLGRELKWSQRRWALERGMNWITWTFDPLQAKNANLNFHHLGVVCHDYLVDFYGPMPGTLGGGQPSDRLLALWLLDSPQVNRLAEAAKDGKAQKAKAQKAKAQGAKTEGAKTEGAKTEGATAERETVSTVWSLEPSDVPPQRSSSPTDLAAAITAKTHAALALVRQAVLARSPSPLVKIGVPSDLTGLFERDPATAALWRAAMRAAMVTALAGGLYVAAFENGAYLLRSEATTEDAP